MSRWKSWKFGPNARVLPVVRLTPLPDADACTKMGIRLTLREPDTVARRHPSGSPPEGLQHIINDPSAFLVKKRRDWDTLKYSRLYAGEVYPIGASYDVVAEDCWLHTPSGTVITRDKRVLAFSSYSLDSFYQGHSEVPWEEAPWVTESSFTLATVWGTNFAHWLMDALPKADALVSHDKRRIVLNRRAPEFQKASLQLLGHCETDVPEGSLIRFKELHFVSSIRSGVPDPRPLLRIRDRFRAGAGTKPDTHPRRLYISRQETRRKILNHADVFPVLQEFGFEEVFCEEIDFAEQIRLFSSTEAIFGAHGAGTLNVLFAPRGSALIEAYNPQVRDHGAHRVASLVGVRHFHLFSGNASKDFDVRIDPNLLARTLALALKAEPPDPRLIETVF